MYFTIYSSLIFLLTYSGVLVSRHYLLRNLLLFSCLFIGYVILRLLILSIAIPERPEQPDRPYESAWGRATGLVVDLFTPFPIIVSPFAAWVDEKITEQREIEYAQSLQTYKVWEEVSGHMTASSLLSILLAFFSTISCMFYSNSLLL